MSGFLIHAAIGLHVGSVGNSTGFAYFPTRPRKYLERRWPPKAKVRSSNLLGRASSECAIAAKCRQIHACTSGPSYARQPDDDQSLAVS